MSDDFWEASGVPAYACLTGLTLKTNITEILPGITLERVFVDTFGTVMMAFAPPERPNSHHPAPWAAVRGGFMFKARVQIALNPIHPLSDYQNSRIIWLIACLLRLRIRAPIRLAVVAPTSFEANKADELSLKAKAFESAPQHFGFFRSKNHEIEEIDIAWLQDMLPVVLRLYDEERFFRAFSIYDQAQWSQTIEVGVALIWSAFEIFFDLSDNREKAKAISKALSDYLGQDRSDRDRTYQRIKNLYHERGRTVHAGRNISINDALECYHLASFIFQKAIIEGHLP